MSKFTVVSVIIFSHLISSCRFQGSTITKESIQKLNDQILGTVDDIFLSLKIPKNFTRQKDVAERLLIHDFIQNVSGRNHKKYKEIHNVSKASVDNNKTAYFIVTINEVLEDIVTRERNPSRTIRLVVTDKTNHTNYLAVGYGLTVNFADFNQRLLKCILKDVVFKLVFASPERSSGDLKEWVPNFTDLETRRIFHGQSTSVRDFPFMASVHIAGQFSCAGVIINRSLVITAASCLRAFHTAQRTPHISIMVRVGSDFANKRGNLVQVTEMYFHPDYDYSSLINNLVILKLREELSFTTKIRKITIDTKAHKLPENVDKLLILGWGDKNERDKTKSSSEPISFAFVKVYNLEECKDVYSRFYVKDKHFCTGYVSKGSGACNYDIGGPAIVGSTLVGIISFGSPYCGRPDAPTVFTKLGYYTKWITTIIEGHHKQYLRHRPMRQTDKSKLSDKDIKNELISLKQLVGEIETEKHINRSINEIVDDFKSKYLKGKHPLRTVINNDPPNKEFESIIMPTPKMKDDYVIPIPDYEDQAELEYETEKAATTQNIERTTPNEPDIEDEKSIANVDIEDDQIYNKIALDRIILTSKSTKHASQKTDDTASDQPERKLQELIKIAERKLHDNYDGFIPVVEETTERRLSTPSWKLKKFTKAAQNKTTVDNDEIENIYSSNENVTGGDLFIDPEDDQNNPTMTTRATKMKRAFRRTTTIPTLKSTKIGAEFLKMMTISTESESAENLKSISRPAPKKSAKTKSSTTKASIQMNNDNEFARSRNKRTQKDSHSKVDAKNGGTMNKTGQNNKFEIVFWNGGTTKRLSEYESDMLKLNIRKSIYETMESSETADNYSDEDVQY